MLVSEYRPMKLYDDPSDIHDQLVADSPNNKSTFKQWT